MLFNGYVHGSEIDFTVHVTNGNVIEYFFSLDDLLDEYGEDSEFMIIYLEGVSIESLEGNEIYFDDIGLN